MQRFAFAAHPRGPDVVQVDVKNIPLMKESFCDALCFTEEEIHRRLSVMRPFIASEIRGRTPSGHEVNGDWLITPRTGEQILQMLSDGRRHEFIELAADTFSLVENRVYVAGTGALHGCGSTGNGRLIERALERRSKRIQLCSGNIGTISATILLLEQLERDFNLRRDKVKIAIVGAGSSVGYAIAISLVFSLSPGSSITLIDRGFHAVAIKAYALAKQTCSVTLLDSLEHLAEQKMSFDIIITTTNFPDLRIKRRHLQPGTILVDVTTPRYIDPDLAEDPEILVILGDLLAADIDCGFSTGSPEEPVKTIYACMGESVVTSLEETRIYLPALTKSRYLGRAKPRQVPLMMSLFRKYGLAPPYPHYGLGNLPIPPQRMDDFYRLRQAK